MDVKRDNRVLSLVNRAGLKGTLSQMLDQLQRCQKSLNEFLEVLFGFTVIYTFSRGVILSHCDLLAVQLSSL